MTVYLIHFQTPYHHARHYIGFCAYDLAARLAHHRAGSGARLLQVVTEAGIDFDVVRTWAGDRRLERRLKNQKKARLLCPCCNPQGWAHHEWASTDATRRVASPHRPYRRII